MATVIPVQSGADGTSMAIKFLLRKLNQRRVWGRLLRERLAEPIHLNLLSVFVALFGNFRSKVYFDLVLRQHHAFGLLTAADLARKCGQTRMTVIEFGVATGYGLMNLCEVGRKVTAATGVEIDVLGFDSGQGMPAPTDYRDHPESYATGDFPMDPDVLLEKLPPNCTLVLGDLAETVTALPRLLAKRGPVGFVSLDVDYYSSAAQALAAFQTIEPTNLLPVVGMHVDDVTFATHNNWAGELLAIDEFNGACGTRKIDRFSFIREQRLFKRADWISQAFALHVLDHPWRRPGNRQRTAATVIDNPYL